MIEFDLKDHGLKTQEIESVKDRISQYVKNIHAKNQGFYRVIDEVVDQGVKNFAAKASYSDIVVLGIGGSALGTICLEQSLRKKELPRLHILDNIDPQWISEIDQKLPYKNTLFLVVTKSGSTPETIAQYFYFRKQTESRGLPIKEHFIFVTDPKKGFLRKKGEEEGITTFDVPENVGGRFSVLTNVGLLPALLLGIDVEALLQGARDMRDAFLNENFEKNLPFQLAAPQYLHGENGKIMNVLMPYSQHLIRFADWFRQLLAESIGKDGKGLTPINALGVTDQHSQLQLYSDGPNDKFFIFMKVKNMGPELAIPSAYSESLEFLNGTSFQKLMHTELDATREALTRKERPNILITIDTVDAYHLGALFMLFEGATAFLGEFYDIDAFDQPGVELAKELTKERLGTFGKMT